MSAGYLRKCAGKRQHATKQEAENHRRQMVRSGRWRLDQTNTYRCNQCGGFHSGRIGVRNRGKR
mgnify:CR=1 FL=1